MVEKSREMVLQRMIKQAEMQGCDHRGKAHVNAVMQGAAEVAAYSSAIRLK